jgi:charged multivesicular body protein 6
VGRALLRFELLQQLKQQRDKVKQYQRRVEQSLERDRLLARKLLVAGRKELMRSLLIVGKC